MGARNTGSCKRPLLRAFRGERTQKEMAQLYGAVQQAWSFWERGLATPPVKTVIKLSKDSGYKVEDLFPDLFDDEKKIPDVKKRIG